MVTAAAAVHVAAVLLHDTNLQNKNTKRLVTLYIYRKMPKQYGNYDRYQWCDGDGENSEKMKKKIFRNKPNNTHGSPSTKKQQHQQQ